MSDDIRSQLFGVIDLARVPDLYASIVLLEPVDAQCLFWGNISEELRQVSPFLVNLARAPALVAKWRSAGRESAWGLMIISKLPLDRLRRKLRTMQQVRLPDNVGPVLFRFWDPRVMRPFLEAVEPEQNERLFDGIDALLVESDGEMLRYTWQGGRLNICPSEFPMLSAH